MWRERAPGLWTADMPVVRLGFELGARMTVVRLPGGGLWVHSPVALTPEIRAGLAAAGPVTDVLAPSRWHWGHLREYAAAYPEARVWAPEALHGRLGGLNLRPALSDAPPSEWDGAIALRGFRGSRLYDEFDFHHTATGTLILTDLLFHFPHTRPPATRLYARLLGILGVVSASKSFRLTVRDPAAVRDSLQALLAWEWDRLIFAHGDLPEAGGREAFRRAFADYL